MADRYINQEDVMAVEYDDRPRQKDKRDIPESPKPNDRKRKSDDMVTAAERGRPSYSSDPHGSGATARSSRKTAD